MSDGAAGSAQKDPLLELLLKNIRQLLITKGRLPTLKALAAELKRVGGGDDPPLRNANVLQLVRDSFDMLVIDLASMREAMTKRHGVFNMLRKEVSRFRRFAPEECDPGPTAFADQDPTAEETAKWEEGLRVWMAGRWNAVLDRLFPSGPQITEDHITDLIKRFRTETEPTDKDRNHVRAHRY